MINYTVKRTIEVQDFDKLVVETYGRPYNFQQQNGCKPRGAVDATIPDQGDDYANDSIPERTNHECMGVSFAAWLARDPEQKLSNPDEQSDWELEMWWERNFYPDVSMVLNDLHEKGLIEAGEYIINIDW